MQVHAWFMESEHEALVMPGSALPSELLSGSLMESIPESNCQ